MSELREVVHDKEKGLENKATLQKQVFLEEKLLSHLTRKEWWNR